MIKHKLLPTRLSSREQGFTIVEVAVIVAVIAVLVAIGTFAYINVKKQSADNAIAAKVEWLDNKLAAYKNKNGEYPTMDALNPGTSATNVAMSDWTAAASILGVTTDYLSGPDNVKFHSQCASGCGGAPQKNQYEYVALFNSNNTANTANTWNIASIGCTVTISYTAPAYVFVYWNSFKGVWIFSKSPQGTATIANYGSGPTAPQTCAFS